MTPLIDYAAHEPIGRGLYLVTSYRLYPHCVPLVWQFVWSSN
jgi:hypothetical protein